VAPLKTTREQAQEAVDALTQHGSQVRAAAAMGLGRAGFQARLARAAEYGLMPTEPVMEGFVIKKVSSSFDEEGNLLREHIQQVKEPGEPFSLPDGHVIKGVSALLDAEGRTVQQWIKTRADAIVPDLVEALKTSFREYEGVVPLVEPPAHTDSELMSVYPIADQHNGLLAWGQESGEDYDLKIGAKRLRDCMARLIAQSPPSHSALVLNLGDWQHTDDQKNMTPRGGNILDVDSRYFKILTTGVRLMMDVIEMALQKHEIVHVRNIPGNHDPHASIALTVALSSAYANNPRVIIDDDPSDFFFYRFGQTLIGATHGHKLKPDRMAMAMAVMRREDWGLTRYHWFLFGHIHHESVKEIGDVRCESFQTLAAKDAYSAGAGYVSGQSLTSITLHEEDGEIGRHRVNLPPPSARCVGN
jgi:predicted phosphodiesterase